MLKQFARSQSSVKLPSRAQLSGQTHRGAQGFQARFKGRADFGAVDDFTGRHARQPSRQVVAVAFGQMHQSLRHAQPRQAATGALALVNGQHIGFGFVAQQGAVGQRAGRDHAHHFALDWAFAGGHIADLFTNGDRLAQFDEARQIRFDRMKGHACHDHRLTVGLTALGERDVQQAHGFFGVAVEQLVKVAHSIKQQRIGVLGLESQVLPHHGRVAVGNRGRAHGCWRVGLFVFVGQTQGFGGFIDFLFGLHAAKFGVTAQQGHQLRINAWVGRHALALL